MKALVSPFLILVIFLNLTNAIPRKNRWGITSLFNGAERETALRRRNDLNYLQGVERDRISKSGAKVGKRLNFVSTNNR